MLPNAPKEEVYSVLMAALNTVPLLKAVHSTDEMVHKIRYWSRKDPARLSGALRDAACNSGHARSPPTPLSTLRQFFSATSFDLKIEALKNIFECSTASKPSCLPQPLAVCLVEFLLSYHMEEKIGAEHLAGQFQRAQRAQQALTTIQSMGVDLQQRACDLAAWRIDPEVAVMYDALLDAPGHQLEARRSLRWMSAMRGPKQAVYATIRRGSKNAKFEKFSLKTSRAPAQSMYSSLIAVLPTKISNDILTLNVSKPFDGNDDTYMSFHGRQVGGFAHSFRLFYEAYEAALLGAWHGDEKAVGDLTRIFLRADMSACADGKAETANLFLAQLNGLSGAVNDVSALWRQIDSGRGSLSNVMSEHVRVFKDDTWPTYVKDRYGKTETVLSSAREQELSDSAVFRAKYFNTELLCARLESENARIFTLGKLTLEKLITEQVDVFLTIERPA